jgi:hypothetical protein
MDTQLTVPADLVTYLRSGLFGVWGFVAEDIANGAIEHGGNASEGYDEPLQAFDAIRTLLDAVGWTNTVAEGDIVINLSVGGAFILEALKREHYVLVDELQELPRTTTSQEIFDIASARVDALDVFVKTVEKEIQQRSRCRTKLSTSPYTLMSGSRPRRRASPTYQPERRRENGS